MIKPFSKITVTRGARLPHWKADGATYAVTFRLADSVPRERRLRWKAQREGILHRAEAMGRALTHVERERLNELFSRRVERWLDRGGGGCVLRRTEAARVVRDALFHFHRQRYDLHAWCVMPNHVHVVVGMRCGHDLSATLHSWKGYSSWAIGRLPGVQVTGPLWQKESYDHLIRDGADMAAQVAYVLENPRRAGLERWEWCGVVEAEPEAGAGQGGGGTDS